MQTYAGYQECGCSDGRIGHCPHESLAPSRFARHWRFNLNLRNGLANWHCYFLSLNAATPGNSFPSSNSRDAPPPVEMNVILPTSPPCFTAVTESPPPTIVVAPDWAIASAIAIVPSPNSGISKTPIGPFHRIVSDLAISS